MRLNSLQLTNFRQHVDTHIDFDDGHHGHHRAERVGQVDDPRGDRVGAVRHPAARGKRESIRSYRAGPRAAVNVELDFELGGASLSRLARADQRRAVPRRRVVADRDLDHRRHRPAARAGSA